MQKNVGSADRIIRVVVGALLGVFVLTKVFTGTLAIILGIVAVILFFTGLAGWCGLYMVIGINTNKCCGTSSKGEGKTSCCSDRD